MSKIKPEIGDTVSLTDARYIKGNITEVELDSGIHKVTVAWEDGKFGDTWYHYETDLIFEASA